MNSGMFEGNWWHEISDISIDEVPVHGWVDVYRREINNRLCMLSTTVADTLYISEARIFNPFYTDTRRTLEELQYNADRVDFLEYYRSNIYLSMNEYKQAKPMRLTELELMARADME